MGLSGLLMDGGGERGEQKNSPLLKCVTQSINLLHPIMMQLGTVIPYLKKIQKIYKSRDTPLEFC